jgi:hypothetical protein
MEGEEDTARRFLEHGHVPADEWSTCPKAIPLHMEALGQRLNPRDGRKLAHDPQAALRAEKRENFLADDMVRQ